MHTTDPSLLIPYFKRVGQTPLDCVREYKKQFLSDSSETVSYAGRLDPMAEGVLLLLRGEANSRRREYEHLSKQYEVTALCGFATDTGDLMGKLSNFQFSIFKCQRETQMQEQLKKVLHSFIGLIEQRYPIYSSMRVRGRPMYWWARQGRLSEITVPSHKVQIDAIELVSESSITDELLLKYIVESVGSVRGDFRQEEIIKHWKDKLSVSTSPFRESNNNKDPDLLPNYLFTLRIDCGSGVYIRQLVADIGEKVNIPLVAFKIKRTRVGKYQLDDCIA